MAEKHKSKYKKPENKKPTYRKDIKDYTMDDKDGKLNPKSAGAMMPNLLRKTDKEMQDDGKIYPTYNADDRLYKDLEDGEYDPKTALKRLKKRQDDEEKNVEDVLKDKIENLTREQKEQLVREYVRRKIAKIISEQALTKTPETETPEPEASAEETPPADAATTTPPPTADAAAQPDVAATPDVETPPAANATSTPAPSDSETTEVGPEERHSLNVSKITDILSGERSNLSRVEILFKSIDNVFGKDADKADVKNFYRLMLRTLAKHFKRIDTQSSVEKK